MPQDDYNPINYTTGQPNPTPFVPGSEYKADVPEGGDKSESLFPSERDEAYMKKRARANVKRFTPKPPVLSYSLAHEARKKK